MFLLAFAASCSGEEPTANAACSDRTIVVDVSSPSRSDEITETARQLIPEALFSAGVCESKIAVVSVAGGQQTVILSQQDLVEFDFVGPNLRARSTNASGQFDEIVDRSVAALNAAYSDTSGPIETDVEALLQAVADHGSAGQAIVLSAGVHGTNPALNRRLADGDGAELAAQVPSPRISAGVSVVFVGVGQPAADVPAPGAAWAREVRSFVETVCKASGAAECTTYADADPALLLAQGSEE